MNQISPLPAATPAPQLLPSSAWYAAAMVKLVGVAQALSRSRSLEDVLSIVRLAARDLTGADGATFVLRDGDKCFYAEENAIAPLWKGQRFPLHTCVSGWVMKHCEAVFIEDIYKDPRVPVEAYSPTFVKSLMMVTIRHNDPIGAIGNYWATTRHVSFQEMHVLQVLADTTALVLENIELREQLKK